MEEVEIKKDEGQDVAPAKAEGEVKAKTVISIQPFPHQEVYMLSEEGDTFPARERSEAAEFAEAARSLQLGEEKK
ncbi:unnamed protein product, partial [Chrysoparadoxa australica]